MRVALIGTRGVPARYGGFETAIEEVGQRLAAKGHEVVVFCRPVEGEQQLDSYLGMQLVHLPIVKVRAAETLAHTALSVVNKALNGVDAAIVFNAANAPLLPVIRARHIPVATHVDGLEWKRGKWGPTGREYYRLAEAFSVRWSDALIADAKGIADYYTEEFNAPTWQIAYGAPIIDSIGTTELEKIGLEAQGFHLVVARFEPENHVLEAVQGYVASKATRPLVVVGSAPYAADYIAQVHAAAEGDERVRFLGSVWNEELLNELYAHGLSYIHGHSVGGTNPSLLRAAGAGAHVIAWDVNFNREVIGSHGAFFSTPEQLAGALEAAEADPAAALADGASLREFIKTYSWDIVADQYEELLKALARDGQQPSSRRPSGQRPGEGNLYGRLGAMGLQVASGVPSTLLKRLPNRSK